MSKQHLIQITYRSIIAVLIVVYQLTGSASAQNVPYRVRSNAAPCLKVRVQPNSDAASDACLTPGTEVNVIATVPFWRQVVYGNNKKGWVAKKYLEALAADTSFIPEQPIPPSALLTMHFVDVAQGDAIWIQTHDDGVDGNGIFEGYSIVIDGGPYSSDNSNTLLPYLERQGHHGADIEALVLTHPHDDHFSGAETITRHFSINHYYDPGYPNQGVSYKAFLKSIKGTANNPAKAKHVHIGEANFGEINWGRELKVEVLYSWKGDAGNTLGSGNTEVNNASIVLRLQYGEHVFLFMGDAEGKDRGDDPTIARYVEKVLLETVPDRLKATVLKIAHHGSETSSTLPFINAVDPDIVVVQSGRKSFGGTFLPDMSTLKRYCDHNPAVRIYRTDQNDRQFRLTGKAAADNDHIVIKSNGAGQPQVMVLQGGQPFATNFCSN